MESVEMEAIDEMITELYSSICFKEGEKPPFEKLRDLFIPDGKLIDNNGEKPVIMTVDEFIAAFEQQISRRSVKWFEEREISGRTEVFRKVAHRFSTYETRLDPDAPEPLSVGINAIQMMKMDGTWRVTCLLWNDQTKETKIPEKYR